MTKGLKVHRVYIGDTGNAELDGARLSRAVEEAPLGIHTVIRIPDDAPWPLTFTLPYRGPEDGLVYVLGESDPEPTFTESGRPIGLRIVSVLLLALLACADTVGPTMAPNAGVPRTVAAASAVPLTDLVGATYQGYPGGLYATGNALTGAHLAAGLARAADIRPRGANGQPSPNGKIVLLSIGMSSPSMEFCGDYPVCTPPSFMSQATADPAVNHTTLVFVNGARGGQTADTWDAPTDVNYTIVRDQRLAPAGLTELQVQVVWLKAVHQHPTVSLPSASADAWLLSRRLARVVRSIKMRYPNVKQVYLSSRIYAGYSLGFVNPEPYAYESGFAVKWLIDAQITQAANNAPVAGNGYGDLRYTTVAPWLAWGPYLWADGTTPRSDGLTWSRGDFAADGGHPSPSGVAKVAAMLLAFFKTSPTTQCWFLAGGVC